MALLALVVAVLACLGAAPFGYAAIMRGVDHRRWLACVANIERLEDELGIGPRALAEAEVRKELTSEPGGIYQITTPLPCVGAAVDPWAQAALDEIKEMEWARVKELAQRRMQQLG